MINKTVYWGLTGIFITVLECDSACSYCYGPLSTNCYGCATVGYIAVNGVCICDVDNNYYMWANGQCNLGCPTGAGWFRDNVTRACVQPPLVSNCTAPYRFGDSMGLVGYGLCTAACASGYFASAIVMKCTQNCYTDSNGQYSYNFGSSGTC